MARSQCSLGVDVMFVYPKDNSASPCAKPLAARCLSHVRHRSISVSLPPLCRRAFPPAHRRSSIEARSVRFRRIRAMHTETKGRYPDGYLIGGRNERSHGAALLTATAEYIGFHIGAASLGFVLSREMRAFREVSITSA